LRLLRDIAIVLQVISLNMARILSLEAAP
jgi:hypothetical protein